MNRFLWWHSCVRCRTAEWEGKQCPDLGEIFHKFIVFNLFSTSEQGNGVSIWRPSIRVMEKRSRRCGEKALPLLYNHIYTCTGGPIPIVYCSEWNTNATFWMTGQSDYPNKRSLLLASERRASFRKRISGVLRHGGNNIVLQPAGFCSSWTPRRATQGLRHR